MDQFCRQAYSNRDRLIFQLAFSSLSVPLFFLLTWLRNLRGDNAIMFQRTYNSLLGQSTDPEMQNKRQGENGHVCQRSTFFI